MSGYFCRICSALFLLCTLLAANSSAVAGKLAGQVTTSDGAPVSAALVTVFDHAGKRKTTVYSAPDGSYAISTAYHGELSVRVRAPFFEDIKIPLAFISYPSPTRVTWLRDWEFTADGKACSSQSNLPSYAIEDGVPSFICVDTEGGSRDREAILGEANDE